MKSEEEKLKGLLEQKEELQKLGVGFPGTKPSIEELKAIAGYSMPSGPSGASAPVGLHISDVLSEEEIIKLIDKRVRQAVLPVIDLLTKVERVLRHPKVLEQDREKAHQKVKEFNDYIKGISDED